MSLFLELKNTNFCASFFEVSITDYQMTSAKKLLSIEPYKHLLPLIEEYENIVKNNTSVSLISKQITDKSGVQRTITYNVYKLILCSDFSKINLSDKRMEIPNSNTIYDDLNTSLKLLRLAEKIHTYFLENSLTFEDIKNEYSKTIPHYKKPNIVVKNMENFIKVIGFHTLTSYSFNKSNILKELINISQKITLDNTEIVSKTFADEIMAEKKKYMVLFKGFSGKVSIFNSRASSDANPLLFDSIEEAKKHMEYSKINDYMIIEAIIKPENIVFMTDFKQGLPEQIQSVISKCQKDEFSTLFTNSDGLVNKPKVKI